MTTLSTCVGEIRAQARRTPYLAHIFCLRGGDPVGERLAKIVAEKNIFLMVCDQCAVGRGLAEGNFEQCGNGHVAVKGSVHRV